MRDKHLLVLFDNLCGLCDHTVSFLLKRDRNHLFKFAPLDGETAAGILERSGLKEPDPSSVILVESFGGPDEMVYIRSEASLRIMRELGGIWKVLSWLRIIPRPLRDFVYNVVAKNRRRWFGTLESCRVPGPETADRFLP